MRLTQTEAFAHITESLLARFAGGKECGKQLNPDLFDGQAYSIDEFYRVYSRYFGEPCGFFRDFASPGSFKLRDASDDALPKRLKGLARQYMFDSPIVTEYPVNNVVPFKWFKDLPKNGGRHCYCSRRAGDDKTRVSKKACARAWWVKGSMPAC